MAEMLFGTLLLSVALFVPGYPFFRAFRFSSISSFIAAPLFSCAVYGVFPLVYYPLGIRCTVASTFGVALILGWGLYLAMRIRGNTTPPARHIHLPQPVGTWIDASRPRELPFDWMLLGLYILCGIVVCSFVFGANLSSADVPYIRYDNQAHLTISKSFLDSGMWSSLHPNRYLDLPLEARSIRSGAISFYPCLLYGITALCSLLSGLTLTAAFNATLFALCAVVFPVGMYGIMRVAFSGKRLIVALGALTTMCFADFPWGIFVRALFPNVAGFCLMTSAIAATVGMGNIAGVAVALSIGGPGAIFWMWVSAVVGMATKFFEGTVAVMYKGKDDAGETQGGPMYMITEGLGRKWKQLEEVFIG